MKKIIILSLAFVLCFNFMTFSAPLSNIAVELDTVNLIVNAKKVDTPTILYNDRTYVPLRAVAENMDADIDWYEDSNTVRIDTGLGTEECIFIMEYYFYIYDTLTSLNDQLKSANEMWKNLCNAYYTGLYEYAGSYKEMAKKYSDLLDSYEESTKLKLAKISHLDENVYNVKNDDYEEHAKFLRSAGDTILAIKNNISEFYNVILTADENNCSQYSEQMHNSYLATLESIHNALLAAREGYYYYHDLSFSFVIGNAN